jgi:hypothetical protein
VATQLQAQTNTSLEHLTAWAADQQKINNQALNAFNHISQIKENPPAGPNVSAAIDWVRATRKPGGSN